MGGTQLHNDPISRSLNFLLAGVLVVYGNGAPVDNLAYVP